MVVNLCTIHGPEARKIDRSMEKKGMHPVQILTHAGAGFIITRKILRLPGYVRNIGGGSP
ncbi:MAG: hypothetical protein B1H13_05980 [Desulfobacteraceae bacterium 4484_190.3]|nr:MAG: hypothetical protein B1H13_05980 [Desulfobacteraceae bacterium 4484_190.3]